MLIRIERDKKIMFENNYAQIFLKTNKKINKFFVLIQMFGHAKCIE